MEGQEEKNEREEPVCQQEGIIDNPQPGENEAEVPTPEVNVSQPECATTEFPEQESEAGKQPEQAPAWKEELEALKEQLAALNKCCEEKFRYDKAKEEMIDKLHKELQVYKEDFHKQIQKPLIMEVLGFSDDMQRLVENFEEEPEAGELLEKYRKLRKEFLKIGEFVDDLFYNYGIEAYRSEAGETYNPRRQRAIRTVNCQTEEEHKKIVRSVKAGYDWEERTLRKEQVVVSVFQEKNLED